MWDLGEDYLEYEPTLVFLKHLTTVDWIIHSINSLTAGILYNAFHFDASDIDELQYINQDIKLV